MTSQTQRRADLHNINIDFGAASRGLCGFTHLASGRVCDLPYRHSGPCRLRSYGTAWQAARSRREPARG